MIRQQLLELWMYRHLVWMFVERDIRARYRQTFIGFAWAIIQPLFMMIILTVIFSKFLNVSTGGIPYPIFSYVVLVPWMFFQRTTTTAPDSMFSGGSVITKIYFPREILPLATVLSNLMDYFIAFGLFIILMFFYRIPFSYHVIIYPLLLLLQIMLATGISFCLSFIGILFQDLKYALPLFVQLWMYASPVVFSASALHPQYQRLLYLNPVTGILQGYRDIFLYHSFPNWTYLSISFFVGLMLFICGYWMFKRFEKTVIDRI